MKLLKFATVPPHKWIVRHLEAEVLISDRSTFKKVKFDRTVCIMIRNGGKLPHYLNGDTSFFDTLADSSIRWSFTNENLSPWKLPESSQTGVRGPLAH